MSINVKTKKADNYFYTPHDYTIRSLYSTETKVLDILSEDAFLINVNLMPPKYFRDFYAIDADKTFFCVTEIKDLNDNLVKCFGDIHATNFSELTFHSFHATETDNLIPTELNTSKSKNKDDAKFKCKHISCACVKVIKKPT